MKDEMKAVLKRMEDFRVNAEHDEALIRELQAHVKKMSATLTQTIDHQQQSANTLAAADATRKQLESDIVQSRHAEHDLRVQVLKLEKGKERESLKANGWFISVRRGMRR